MCMTDARWKQARDMKCELRWGHDDQSRVIDTRKGRDNTSSYLYSTYASERIRSASLNHNPPKLHKTVLHKL